MCVSDNLMLPSTTYKSNRHSAISQRSDPSGNGEEFFIPMALDPNPAPGPSPLTRHHKFDQAAEMTAKPAPADTKALSRDYFHTNGQASTTPSRVASQDYDTSRTTPTSNSPRESRHSSQPSSPHIAYQEIGREPSSDLADTIRKRKDHGMPLGSINSLAQEKPRDVSGELRSRPNGESRNGKFMLQEVPKTKKSGSTRSSHSDEISPSLDTTSLASSKSSSAPTSAITHPKEQPTTTTTTDSPPSLRPNKSLNGSPLATHDVKGHDLGLIDSPTSQSSLASTQLHHLPERRDSLAKSGTSKHHARKDLGEGHLAKQSSNISHPDPEYEKLASVPPSLLPGFNPSLANPTTSRSTSKLADSPSSGNAVDTTHHPPSRARDRDRPALAAASAGDSFTAPRAPPNPPGGGHKSNNPSVSTLKSENSRHGEPSLPRYSAGNEFSMDEELARILGNENHPDHASFLRRVSNSVRHTRSYSDRGTRLSREQKWPKSPLQAAPTDAFGDMSSPPPSSPESKEELTWLKNELHREKQRTVEREQRLAELEAALEAKSSIRQMNTELREKRSTIVDLDTQKEIVVRELELLTEHIAAAKKSEEPLDLAGMSNLVLREFAESLQKLKDSFAPHIEELTQNRNELKEEVAELTQLRDKSAQEFEQLSQKNADLAKLNNQLVNELYKSVPASSLDARSSPNGLGIYTHPIKDRSNRSIDGREAQPSIAESSSMTGSTVVHELDGDSATYLAAPQVVNIRKAQPKKFNWKRGGQHVAKGVTKGLKGAFTSNDPNKLHRDGPFSEGSTPSSVQPGQQEYSSGGGNQSKMQMHDPNRQGFGLFGNQKQKPLSKNASNSAVSMVNADGSPGKGTRLESLLSRLADSFF